MDRQCVLDEPTLHEAFDLFDQDGDGRITWREVRDVLEGELSEIDEEVWQDIVRQVDTNADGNIDFEEFREVMRKFAEESKLSQEEV